MISHYFNRNSGSYPGCWSAQYNRDYWQPKVWTAIAIEQASEAGFYGRTGCYCQYGCGCQQQGGLFPSSSPYWRLQQ